MLASIPHQNYRKILPENNIKLTLKHDIRILQMPCPGISLVLGLREAECRFLLFVVSRAPTKDDVTDGHSIYNEEYLDRKSAQRMASCAISRGFRPLFNVLLGRWGPYRMLVLISF